MASRGWWGNGLAPHLRWQGVTIEIPAVWSRERKRWESSDGRYYFDREEAERAREVYETELFHSDGKFAGQPFKLEPWQWALFVAPLFGWKRTSDGLRRFRKVRLFVAKKNGKTYLAGGVGIFAVFCDGESGANVICNATDREQAKIVYRAIKGMVEDSPTFAPLAECFKNSISYGRSTLQVVSSDVKSKHGPNISCLISDEFHAQPDRHLYEVLSKGVAARSQPIDLIITTAGDNQESICYEEYEYAKGVMAGTIEDDTVLPIIFEAAQTDDWTKPETWAKANPSIDVTVTYEYLAGECAAAQADPRKQASFKQLHLNMWTQQSVIWIPIEWHDACEQPEVGKRDYDAQVCGLDLSSKIDLTSFVIVRRIPGAPVLEIGGDTEQADHDRTDEDDKGDDQQQSTKLTIDFSIEVIPFFWMPEETLRDHVKTDRVPYDVWHKSGLLRMTDGAVVDYDQMLDDIVTDIAPKYGLALDGRGANAPNVRKDHRGTVIAFDPWNAGQFSQALRHQGFLPLEIPQNVQRLSEPSKLFHALEKAGRAWHDGHRVYRMCVANVTAKEDKRGNVYPHKVSQRKRIDGVLATINALGQLIVEPKRTKQTSVYQRRGVIWLQ